MKAFYYPDPCNNYCRNGVTNCSTDLHNNPKCECPPEYEGDACEYPIRKLIFLFFRFVLYFVFKKLKRYKYVPLFSYIILFPFN